MELFSQYLMLLHQGWFALVNFFDALVKENKTLRCLKSHPLPQLGWSKWKSLELPKEMSQPSQALPFSRIKWEHLPCPTSLIRTFEFVSFPSFSPPPISSFLVSPSPKLQVLEKILVHVFLESQILMEECIPLDSQDTNHNPKDVEMLIYQHVLPVHYVIYFWISPYLKESWNFRYDTPPKKTQNGNAYNGKKKKKHN